MVRSPGPPADRRSGRCCDPIGPDDLSELGAGLDGCGRGSRLATGDDEPATIDPADGPQRELADGEADADADPLIGRLQTTLGLEPGPRRGGDRARTIRPIGKQRISGEAQRVPARLVDRVDEATETVVEDAAQLVDAGRGLAQCPDELGEAADVRCQDDRLDPLDIGLRRRVLEQAPADDPRDEAQERVGGHQGGAIACAE